MDFVCSKNVIKRKIYETPIEKYYRTFRSFWGLKQGGDPPPEKATAKEGGGRLMDRTCKIKLPMLQ